MTAKNETADATDAGSQAILWRQRLEISMSSELTGSRRGSLVEEISLANLSVVQEQETDGDHGEHPPTTKETSTSLVHVEEDQDVALSASVRLLRAQMASGQLRYGPCIRKLSMAPEEDLISVRKPSFVLPMTSNGDIEDDLWFEESIQATALQVFVPFLAAGFGTVGAGLLLDLVQHWPVFQKVTELFILVPALLGLKGNLEMTMAARMSTQANLGHMDTLREQWKMASGNMALVQVRPAL